MNEETFPFWNLLRCHWSTHHAEDPSWSLLNIEFLNNAAVFAAASVVAALGATELAEELGTSSTACAYPFQHSLALCLHLPHVLQ